ncbi:MAG TPA: hypothetical protein VIF15_18860 [Polyangiaceae bacterium]
MRGPAAVILAGALLACGATSNGGFGDGTGNDGGTTGPGGEGGTFGGDDSGSFGGQGGPTFGTTCNGTATSVTGTVYAPNGTDPLPNIYVYAAAKVNPFPAGNFCNQCNSPLDNWYSHTQSGNDGTFSLSLSNVPAGADIQLVINVGRFRKVTPLPVKCGSNAAPKAATTLPGKAADGDIPKIAVSTGNSDHLDQILGVLGITEYDCYEGRASTGSSSPTCQPVDSLSNLLLKKSATPIDAYHLLFVSCAPNAFKNYATSGVNTATLSSNVSSFVTSGGRLFATDMSYDYVAQAFPSAITWQGPTGAPQPVDGANVGAAGSYNGNVDDPSLKAWMTGLGVPTSPVPLQGFLNPWSVQASLPKTSTLIVDGTVSYTGAGGATSGDVPLTSQFDVSACGRVVYSSYHTAGGTVTPGNLLPQERILEYLVFEVGSCVTPTPQ